MLNQDWGLQAKRPGVGLTLPEIRERARELAKVAVDHGDVRAHLQDLENQAELARIEREREIQALRVQGSFEELFREYIEDRRGRYAMTRSGSMSAS